MTTRRPKPEASRWLIDQRKRRGWKPEDLADRLDIAVATVRGWESGRGIGPESLMRLEALFGVQSPDTSVSTAGSDAVAAAINRQTDMLERMLGEIRDAFTLQGEQVAAVLGVVTTQRAEMPPALTELVEGLLRERTGAAPQGGPATPARPVTTTT
jgi:hypothetical protein